MEQSDLELWLSTPQAQLALSACRKLNKIGKLIGKAIPLSKIEEVMQRNGNVGPLGELMLTAEEVSAHRDFVALLSRLAI